MTIHVERSTRFIEHRANGTGAKRDQWIDQDCASLRGEFAKRLAWRGVCGLPCGPAGRRHRPPRTHIAAPTDRASASARTRLATRPSAGTPPQATSWGRPCPARPSAPPGNRRSRRHAGEAPATAHPDFWSAGPQRQDRRAEPDPLAISGRPAVANLRPRNLDRATHLDKDELRWFGSIAGEDLATPSVFR